MLRTIMHKPHTLPGRGDPFSMSKTTLMNFIARGLLVITSVALTVGHVAPASAYVVESSDKLSDAWLGAWMGNVVSPSINGKPGLDLPVTIVVRAGAAGPEIDITVLTAGALAKPAVEIVGDANDLAFTLDSGGKRARFEGALNDDHTLVAGSFAFLDAKGSMMPPPCVWSMHRIDLVTSVAGARVYDAVLDAMGQKLPMRLALGEGPHGWCGAIEIISQGVRELAVGVERTATGFKVRLPVGSVATIELAADAEMKVLEGTFSQATFRGPIRFELVADAKLAGPRRPQDPVAPFPYQETEVRIDHPNGNTLGGTLTIPADKGLARAGRLPAVVLVTGSGPQNRNEELLGHRPFAVIADALARAGVAVLRCDDRGVGASTGAFAGATSIDFASDADIASEWLKRQPTIDAARVGMIGHSEGAMIAPIVAMWQNAGDSPVDPLAFIVLLAPPAESGAQTLTRQTARMYEVSGTPVDKLAVAVAAHAAVMRAIEQFRAADALQPLVVELIRSQLALSNQPTPDDAAMASIIDGAMKQLTDPWMVEFIRFDPRPVLVRLEVPTLAMCGSKDVQVVAEANLGLLEEIKAKSGAPITIRRYPGLNHLFQPATTGLPDEYSTIETTFDPKALAEMVAWVVETAKAAPAPQIPQATRAGFSTDAADVAAIPQRLWLLKPATAIQPTGAQP